MERVFIFQDTMKAVDRPLYWTTKPEEGTTSYVRSDIHSAAVKDLHELTAQVKEALPDGFDNLKRYVEHLEQKAETERTSAHLARQVAKQNADEVGRIKRAHSRQDEQNRVALAAHKKTIDQLKHDNNMLKQSATDNARRVRDLQRRIRELEDAQG